MEKRRTKHCLAGVAGIMALVSLLLIVNDNRTTEVGEVRSNTPGLSAAGGETDDGALSKPAKSGERPSAPKPATDQELAKFSRFFLPPIKLKEATIEQAVAAIIAAYRETAEATGEPALDLRVETNHARTRKPITCTTPRAPAGTVLRYVASIAGNRTKGSLPSFRLEALSDTPDRKGKLKLPPGWESWVADFLASAGKSSEAKLGENPFEDFKRNHGAKDAPFSTTPAAKLNPQDLLASLDFNPAARCQSSSSPDLSHDNLSYEDMSEAEVEWLSALVETATRDGLGPIQIKSDTKVLVIPESLAESFRSGTTLNDGEVQLSMRVFAQTKGVDLMTLPAITGRESQIGTVEITSSQLSGAGADTWQGVRMATTSVPYGLGSQTEFALEARNPDGTHAQVREQITLPENSNGVAITPYTEGQRLILLQRNSMIDSTGNPVAASR
jgi:hypothetical protein